MVALKADGIEQVAVVLKPSTDSFERREPQRIELIGQNFAGGRASGKVDIARAIPLSEKYRTEILEEFAENPDADVRYSLPRDRYAEYNKPITIDDIKTLRSIGRKSVNNFEPADLEKAQKWAYKFYQQFGEKSPFFRAWFGDWRAYDISAANVVSFAYGENPKLNYSKRFIDCKELNAKILVDETVINDSLSYAKKNGDEKQIRKLLGKVDEILSNGVLLDTRISERNSGNKKGSTQFMHYLYTPISINGAPFIAKLSIEEYDLTGKTRAYNLQRIELSEVSRAQYSQLIAENREKYAYTSDALSVAQLFDFVKQKDKNFTPKPVDKHLVNEDGTPKKFYHGTNADFTEFNPDEFASREGSFFFAENREDAAAYGNNVFEVYLTGDKFADYDNQPLEFYQLRDKRKQVEYLKEREYDGWYADMDSGGWGEVSVFSNTQIKSAEKGTPTSNIGTFDKTEGDIRYSIPRNAKDLTHTEIFDLVEKGEMTSEEGFTVLREKYGTMKPGEKPKVDAKFPEKISATKDVMQYTRTVAESGHLDEGMSDTQRREILKGGMTYQVISDKPAIAKADEEIQLL